MMTTMTATDGDYHVSVREYSSVSPALAPGEVGRTIRLSTPVAMPRLP